MTSKPAVQKRTARPRRMGQPLDRSAHGDPGSDRGESETEAEDEVREGREAFRIRVEQEQRQRDRGQQERQPVQARGRGDEECDRGDEKDSRESDRQRARGQRARGGPGVRRVEAPVGQAVVGHGGTARADHREEDLDERHRRRPAAGGEERRVEREGQREKGVRELDHLERRPERPEDARLRAHREGRRGPGREAPFAPALPGRPFHRNSSPRGARPSARAARTHHASRKRSTEGESM